MEIAVAARHIVIPEDLKRTTEEKVGNLSKYLEGMERAEVRFFEERNPRIAEPDGCEVTITGHGHVVRARATGSGPTMALDRVVDKVGHQLTRLKKKLVGRSHPHHGHRYERAGAGAPAALDGIGRAERKDGSGVPRGDALDEDWSLDEDGPRIVRTKTFAIKPTTPEEAVLQMELVSHDFYFFSNAETGRPAVVYRRRGGDYGLIDST